MSMNNYCYSICIILSIIILCHCQTYPYITQPKLTSVTPINSTALNVTWQFADASLDLSDLIRVSIVFYEYYLGYTNVYASTNYTFTSTNKTVTNLVRNFDFVNAYYYVCFSSNSTITNVSIFLAVTNCILARTCLRSNAACPGPSSAIIVPTSVSANSFILSFLWPIDFPGTPTSVGASLINKGQIGTALSAAQNTSYINYPYQFTGLQSGTAYTVNTTFTYTILNITSNTNMTTTTVTTSSSSKLFYPSDLLLSIFVVFSVIFFA